MLKVLVPAVGLLGLLAVAAQPSAPEIEVQENPLPMGWHLHYEGDMAKLAYGVANSDQLALMMTCEPGAREVVVYGDVHPEGARLTRVSDAMAEPDPLSMGIAYEVAMRVSDPVLHRFASDGRLPVESQTGVRHIGATDSEKSLVSSFIRYCESGRA